MRSLSLALSLGFLLVACHRGGPGVVGPAPAPDYPATRWVPAGPTYVVAGKLREAQQAAGSLTAALGLDLDAAAPIADLGLAPDGDFAVFSQALDPTLVVQLADPARTRGFLDRVTAGWTAAAPQQVAGVELITREARDVQLQWAIADGWLWLHLGLPGAARSTAWLTASRAPANTSWLPQWQWARGTAGAPPDALGFVDVRAVVSAAAPRAGAALACVALLDGVERASVALEASSDRAGVRVALDLGAGAAAVTRAVLPPPAGWAAFAAGAPVAAQWNLDLDATRARLQPCTDALGLDVGSLAAYGVRAARLALEHHDPDDLARGRGAVSLALSRADFFRAALDRIPLRSSFERDRSFGGLPGKSLSIPLGPTVDYVLTADTAAVGLGEGVLARVFAGRAAAPPPLLAIDLRPEALPRAAWADLFAKLSLPRGLTERLLHHLLAWRAWHVSLAVEGAHLVFETSASRR